MLQEIEERDKRESLFYIKIILREAKCYLVPLIFHWFREHQRSLLQEFFL
jgi:hypothetical protein